MRGLLGRKALSFGDDSHDVADLVLVGLIIGEWGALRAGVVCGLDLQARHPDLPQADELRRALTAFRYERRLIAAAELRDWLKERSIGIDELEGFQRRELLRAQFESDGTAAVSDDSIASVIETEAICGGALGRWGNALITWHAAAESLATRPEGGDAIVAPATPERAAEIVIAARADPTTGLHSLDESEVERRLAQLTALHAAYEWTRRHAVSEEEVAARIVRNGAEWTVVTGRQLSFASEGAARETRLRVVHDGDTLPDLAASLGLELLDCEFEVGDAPSEVAPQLLGAADGELVGPWSDRDRWIVLEIARIRTPVPDGDAKVDARAREELLDEMLARAAAGKVSILGAL